MKIAIFAIAIMLSGCARTNDESAQQLKTVNAELEVISAQLEETNQSLTQLHEDLDGMDTILENMHH